MMASKDPLQRLPLEMQVQILGYLSIQDHLNLRQASHSSNQIVKDSGLLSFRECLLTDSTAKYILASQESRVTEVVVTHLSTSDLLLTPTEGTVLQEASKLTLGSQVAPHNLTSILCYCKSIQSVHFKDSDASVVSTFLQFNQGHSSITQLSLYFNICSPNTSEQVIHLISKLRLPSLKTFKALVNPGFDSSEVSYLMNPTELSSWHTIYCTVHKLVVKHQESLTELDWNFSGLVPTSAFQPGPQESFKYFQLRSQVCRVNCLKKICIHRFHSEGSNYFNLAVALLLSQTTLESLTLVTQPGAYTSGIQFIIQRNKDTLKHLSLSQPQFPLPLIEPLSSLESLRVQTYHWSRYWPGHILTEEDLEHHALLPFPKTLTDLSLEVESLCCTNEVDPIHHFITSQLVHLTRLELSLKLENTERHVYPSVPQFLRIFSLPRLIQSTTNFFAKHGADSVLILDKRQVLQGICSGVPGLSTHTSDKLQVDDEANFNYSHMFQLSVRINRKRFRGFAQD